MKKKLIPLTYKTYTESRGSRTIPTKNDFELDYNNFEADVKSINQFIRGVLKIPILCGKKINFLKSDKIYTINDRAEIVEKERTEEELLDSFVYGIFEYTKSLAGIERFFFNRSVALETRCKSNLHKIVSDLITEELERQKAAKK